jgi:predicted permease
MLHEFLNDLRFGSRILSRSPGFSLAVVTLLALVIGGNTTLFSMINGIIRKAAPGVHSTRLVTLAQMKDGQLDDPFDSYPDYLNYVQQSKTANSLVAVGNELSTVTISNATYAVTSALVSGSYFDTLGVKLIHGRAFEKSEIAANAADLVAVISERLWRNQFEAAENIIGRTIVVNDKAATIVGVTPQEFHGTGGGSLVDVWVPAPNYLRLSGKAAVLEDRADRRFYIFSSLAPGASLASARAEFRGISRQLEEEYPETNQRRLVYPTAYSIGAGGVWVQNAPTLILVLTVLAALTLTIVCANVANLMLARYADKQRDSAIRQALGASRLRLMRLRLSESLVLGLVAWIASCACTFWMSTVLATVVPSGTPGGLAWDFSPDWNVVMYAFALSFFAILVFTLVPLLRNSTFSQIAFLRAGVMASTGVASRLSKVLVVTQLALSVFLLTSAGLGYRSLNRLAQFDPGLKADNLLLVALRTKSSAQNAEANVVLLERIRERFRLIPGISDTSYVRRGPLERIATKGGREPLRVTTYYVGPDYLKVLGLRPVLGEEFAPANMASGPDSGFVNQNLADAVGGASSLVGQTLNLDRSKATMRVVGVAPNAFFGGSPRDRRPVYLFLNERQNPTGPGEVTFYLRHSGPWDAAQASIVSALAEVDNRIPIIQMRTMGEELAGTAGTTRLITTLLAWFAIGSCVIAIIGQYAVIRFTTSRRTRDFGLRAAIGATSSQILRSVILDACKLTATGLIIGVILSVAAGRVLGNLLYGITATDAVIHFAVFLIVSTASLAACYFPARRASRIDPIQALRYD